MFADIDAVLDEDITGVLKYRTANLCFCSEILDDSAEEHGFTQITYEPLAWCDPELI